MLVLIVVTNFLTKLFEHLTKKQLMLIQKEIYWKSAVKYVRKNYPLLFIFEGMPLTNIKNTIIQLKIRKLSAVIYVAKHLM